MKQISGSFVVLGVAFILGGALEADELVQNSKFDQGFTGSCPHYQVANSYTRWVKVGDPDYCKETAHYRDPAFAQEIGKDSSAYRAGLLQQVPLGAGRTVTVTGWIYATSNESGDFNVERGIGVDPAGGTDPDAAGVVWHRRWDNQSGGEMGVFKQYSVTVTSTAGTITIFTWIYNKWNFSTHSVHDDVSLPFTYAVDIDITDDNNQVLNEAQEDDPGSTATVNNDDDNVSNPDGPGSDMDEAGFVDGENDLRRIVIQPPAAGISSVTITWTALSNKIKIFEGADRTVEISSGQQYTAAQIGSGKNLYLEARSVFLNETIRCQQTGGEPADTVEISSMQFNSPQYVPDHSNHTYNIVPPIAGNVTAFVFPAAAGNITPLGGNSFRVFWKSGPQTAKVVGTPPGGKLPTSKDVVIIDVQVAAPDTGPAFEGGAVMDDGSGVPPSPQILYKNTKALGNGGKRGSEWKAKVSLDGPSAHHGVQKLRISFIQNVTITAREGRYATVNKTRTSNLSFGGGGPYLDSGVGSAKPWYASQDSGSVFFDATPAVRVKTIGSGDSPDLPVPLTYDLGINVDPAADDIVDVITHRLDFDLAVCAQTVEAPAVYTKQATSRWSAIGNGTVIQIFPYSWISSQIGNTMVIPTGWAEVADGSEPVTTGLTANELAATEIWF